MSHDLRTNAAIADIVFGGVERAHPADYAFFFVPEHKRNTTLDFGDRVFWSWTNTPLPSTR